jgi:hypothetical protein
MLVRPDGYVAWASGEPPSSLGEDALSAVLEHWCGPPTRTGRARHVPAHAA